MLQSISLAMVYMWPKLHISMTEAFPATLGELFPLPGPSEPTRAIITS